MLWAEGISKPYLGFAIIMGPALVALGILTFVALAWKLKTFDVTRG
jgi:hypothetical protein